MRQASSYIRPSDSGKYVDAGLLVNQPKPYKSENSVRRWLVSKPTKSLHAKMQRYAENLGIVAAPTFIRALFRS
jgi:hypothetical protein